MDKVIFNLVNAVWLLVLLSYIVFSIICIIGSKKHHLNIENTMFYIFETLSKALNKCLVYGLETVIIGVLLAMLFAKPDDLNEISNMSEILKTAFLCLTPLFSLIWIAELLDVVKENYTKKEGTNSQPNWWLIIVPAAIDILVYILTVLAV